MRRRTALAAGAGAAVLAGAIAAVASTGPSAPLARELTSNGRTIWNLDALVNDANGARVDCYDAKRDEIFSVVKGGACPSPQARYQVYAFTFLNAFHSQFTLVSRSAPPQTGATTVALRLDGRYVSCPNGLYHHGGRGWLVAGGGVGPNAYFWCS
jgi:hypothetical protein